MDWKMDWKKVALVAVAALTLAAGPTWAADDTTAKVTIESTSAAAGFGYQWGSGVLEYRGQLYPFTVQGFSIIDVGFAKLAATGQVFNLEKVEDFDGLFMAAVAGGSLGGGAGAAAMQNQHGVKMVLTTTNQGLNFSLAQAGFNLRRTPEARQQAAKNRLMTDGQPAAMPRK